MQSGDECQRGYDTTSAEQVELSRKASPYQF